MTPTHADIADADISIVSAAKLDLCLHVHADDVDPSARVFVFAKRLQYYILRVRLRDFQ